MPFTRITELFAGREGSLSDGLERDYTRKFRVVTDSKLVGPIEVMFAPGIPRLYERYVSFLTNEIDALALCRKVNPVQDPQDWSVWDVTCEYSTRSPSGSEAGQPDNPGDPSKGDGASNNPELEPPVVRWDAATREVAMQQDLDGNAIINTARQPFDPPPTIEESWPVLHYERNELNFDWHFAAGFAHTVNRDRFLGEDPGFVLCKPIVSEKRYRGPLVYWRTKYEFHFAQRSWGWDLELLNQGLCQFKPLAKGPSPIIENGQPVTQPRLLNAIGLKMDVSGTVGVDWEPIFLRFKRYFRRPFGPLRITGV